MVYITLVSLLLSNTANNFYSKLKLAKVIYTYFKGNGVALSVICAVKTQEKHITTTS